jgi:hypothetical protein
MFPWGSKRVPQVPKTFQVAPSYWGGVGIFFHFSWFPICSFKVPNVFPNIVSLPPHFYPICLGKCCRPFTQIGGQKGRNSILQKEPSILGSLNSFFFGSDGPIKLAHCKNKKIKNRTWEPPHLINRRGE